MESSSNPLAPQIADLVMSGVYWVERLGCNNRPIRFSEWARSVMTARGAVSGPSADQLKWLWTSITSEPRISSHFGKRLKSLDDEWKDLEPIEIVPKGSRFGIFLKNFRSIGYPVMNLNRDAVPDASAEVIKPFYFRPGKARRLECKDVPTRLSIQLTDLGSQSQEAAALKVEVKDIEIDENTTLIVNVKSLNHAYTKASFRLKPHRRSHGGRVFDHVALIDEDKLIPLEKLRVEEEKRLWSELLGIDRRPEAPPHRVSPRQRSRSDNSEPSN